MKHTKMKVALFFGSFNPIHIGHLIIANHVINFTEFKKIWLILSPQNPLKPSKTLLNEYDRLHLVRVAIEDDPNLKVSDIEFKLPKPSYTIHTLTYLQQNYQTHEFAVIMGSDSFQNIRRWKNYQEILNNYKIIIYNRPGFEVNEANAAQTVLSDAPLINISSTTIRDLIKEKKSIRYLVPEKVREEIEASGYYKTK